MSVFVVCQSFWSASLYTVSVFVVCQSLWSASLYSVSVFTYCLFLYSVHLYSLPVFTVCQSLQPASPVSFPIPHYFSASIIVQNSHIQSVYIVEKRPSLSQAVLLDQAPGNICRSKKHSKNWTDKTYWVPDDTRAVRGWAAISPTSATQRERTDPVWHQPLLPTVTAEGGVESTQTRQCSKRTFCGREKKHDTYEF